MEQHQTNVNNNDHTDDDHHHSPVNSFQSLPTELLMEVFCFCSFDDLYAISLVSKNFSKTVGTTPRLQEDSELDDPNTTQAKIFSSKYYLETRKSMEKILSPEVIYQGDDSSVVHSKIRSLLFDWKYLNSGRKVKKTHLDGFLELERDLQYISSNGFDWKYFEELTEKLNSVSIVSGPKTWYGFSLLDKRGERIPIFCRISQQYEMASREMNFIVLGLFDSNNNLTGNLQETTKIEEAIFYYEYLGFDSMSSFTGFDWMKEHFTNYIREEEGLALFGSALEFYILMLGGRRFSRTAKYPPIKEDRSEYYFCDYIAMTLCCNSLYSGVSQQYGSSNLIYGLSSFGFEVKLFYSNHKRKLESLQQQ